MIITILGTDYKIILDADESSYPILKNADGYVDFSVKEIVIPKFVSSEHDMRDLEYYQAKVLRHEIVHAYMYESGLDVNSEWGRDETLIDWIAIQLPKIATSFKHLNLNK